MSAERHHLKNIQRNCSESGATLIEVMIAGALVIVAATSILPVFFFTTKTNKGTEFREICTKALHSKLVQYRNGRTANLSTVPVGSLDSGLNAAVKNGVYQTLNTNSGGWVLAKWIYNLRSPTSAGGTDCIPDNDRTTYPPILPPSSPSNLGVEEAVGSIATLPGQSAPNYDCASGLCGDSTSACPCPEDQAIANQLGTGFRIFTHMQRVHSMGFIDRSPGLVYNSDLGAGGDCPSEGIAKFGAANPNWAKHYGFDGYTDGIKITVTALLDLNRGATGTRTNFAGMKAGDPASSTLMCSASEILRPPIHVARYVLGRYIPPSDPADAATLHWPTEADCGPGGTYENRCEGAIMDMVGRPVFRGLWNNNLKGINIAPNNRAVYVLTNTGDIYRYGDETNVQTLGSTCIGAPAECTSDGSGDPTKLLTPTTIGHFAAIKAFGLTYIHYSSSIGGLDNFSFFPKMLKVMVENHSGVNIATVSGFAPGTDISASISQISAPSNTLNSFASPPVGDTSTRGFDSWFMNFRGNQSYVLVNSCGSVDTSSNSNSAYQSYCAAIYRFEDSTNVDNATPLERTKFNIRALSP